MKATEAIGHFLREQTTGAVDLFPLYNGGLECQVNVIGGTHKDNGTHSDDLGNKWWNIRVPKQAGSNPHFNDYPLKWPLDKYADAIGLTGWDWVAKQSKWVGFDFDAITGHAQGVGISDEELNEVKTRASDLPYVQVRKSTGGKGLHLYV